MILDHFWVDPGPFWGHFEITLASFWHHFGFLCISFRRFDVFLGIFLCERRGHFGDFGSKNCVKTLKPYFEEDT